jgi:zf-MYND-like zinc finger, mRNA-binding
MAFEIPLGQDRFTPNLTVSAFSHAPYPIPFFLLHSPPPSCTVATYIRKGPMTVLLCSSPGCTNTSEARLACPKCLQLGLSPVYFCSQDCFKQNYATHKKVHSVAKSSFAAAPTRYAKEKTSCLVVKGWWGEFYLPVCVVARKQYVEELLSHTLPKLGLLFRTTICLQH